MKRTSTADHWFVLQYSSVFVDHIVIFSQISFEIITMISLPQDDCSKGISNRSQLLFLMSLFFVHYPEVRVFSGSNWESNEVALRRVLVYINGGTTAT